MIIETNLLTKRIEISLTEDKIKGSSLSGIKDSKLIEDKISSLEISLTESKIKEVSARLDLKGW